MAAEWSMRGYRVQKGKLWNLKPSPKLRAAILRAARAADLVRDPRLGAPFETLLDELFAQKLAKPHARGYRILLEAVADATQKRIRFDVNPLSKGYSLLTTYAVRDHVPKVLAKLGAKFTAKSFDKPTCPWPWLGREPKVKWPSASLWSPAEVTFRERELREAGAKDKALDARLVPIVGDPASASEMGDVIRALYAMFKGASGQSLVILLDGEQ